MFIITGGIPVMTDRGVVTVSRSSNLQKHTWRRTARSKLPGEVLHIHIRYVWIYIYIYMRMHMLF